ncbi:DUF2303 family protein [Streptomyces sp. NPDC057257]|uniref:DUF2303 family protein n=1 Tax=Streptomyces sp. NPDC057257 TaxID=3346071 RepID=UPI00363E38B2
MPNTDAASIQTIAELTRQSLAPKDVEPGNIYLVATADGRVQTVDLTGPEYTGMVARKVGTTTVRDAESFLTYWTKHHDDASEVYADSEFLTVTAVLDAHSTDEPGFGGHRLHLALRESTTWKQWLRNDGELLGQEDFAEFLEDHLPELLEPDAATMLEIAQSFQANSKVDFQSATRLGSGQRQFQYVETQTTKAGQKGDITVPESFVIGLVPFDGSPGYKLTARLRYRIGQDKLRLGYKLDRPDEIRKTAFADVVKTIREQIETPVMNGTPA